MIKEALQGILQGQQSQVMQPPMMPMMGQQMMQAPQLDPYGQQRSGLRSALMGRMMNVGL